MGREDRVQVRLLGCLHALRKARGLPAAFAIRVPPEGRAGSEIATENGLPLEKIEAVFRNGRVQDLSAPIFPGDRVAFVPYGPYRVLLGIRKDSGRAPRRKGCNGRGKP